MADISHSARRAPTLADGVALRSAGKLAEAEAICRDLLATNPN